MLAEKLFFLQTISNHLKREKTIVPDGLNWDLIIQYAQDHKIEGILYYQCKDYLKKQPQLVDAYKTLLKEYYKSIYRYIKIEKTVNELQRALNEEEIPFLIVKGIMISQLYPIPALRTMCDIDVVLINEHDREKANEILNRIGFVTKKGAFEWNLYRDGIGVELHDHLVYGENDNSERSNLFCGFSNHITHVGNECYELNKDYHFVYLIEHLRKHFTSHGVGFRQFIDIAILCLEYGTEFDWIWIEENCRKVQLWDFVKHVLSFCCEWWGLNFDVPFQLPNHSEEFWEEATNSIFLNGVFGFQNEQHMENAIRSIRHPQKAPSMFRAIILMFNLVCRPYSEMVRYPYCAFLNKKVFLLPIAWIYRLIYILRSNKYRHSHLIKKIHRAIVDDDCYTKYKSKWGL